MADGSSPADYDRAQRSWALLLATGLASPLMLGAALLAPLPGAGPRVVLALGGAVLLLVALVFSRLRVRVADGRLHVAFGAGWPARTFALADLVEAQAARNRWWWGFGIRWTPHGWMWNVSGLDAVQLTFRDGRRFRVGTADPQGLLTALRAATPTSAPRG